MKTVRINFIASVNDEFVGDVNLIIEKLKKLGCEINNVLQFSGIITGTIPSNIQLNEIKIDGIKNIELDRTLTIN